MIPETIENDAAMTRLTQLVSQANRRLERARGQARRIRDRLARELQNKPEDGWRCAG